MKKLFTILIAAWAGILSAQDLGGPGLKYPPLPPHFLRDHLDVSFNNLTTGSVPIYNGTGWGTTILSGGANEVIVGTGTGITSYSSFTYDNSTNILNVTGALNPKIQVQRTTSGAAYFELINTTNTWQMLCNAGDFYIEPNVVNGEIYFRNLANTALFRFNLNSGIARYLTGTTVRIEGKGSTGLTLTGYDTNEALTTIGLGTGFSISGGNLTYNPATGLAFVQNGNSFGAAATLGTNDNQDLRFETNGTSRMSINATDGHLANEVANNSVGVLLHQFARSTTATQQDDDYTYCAYSQEDDAGNQTDYVTLKYVAANVGNGVEEGQLVVNVMKAGAATDVFKAGAQGITAVGDVILDKTITPGGTTGAQTINKTTGSVNFAAAATSLVVTNNLVSASSIIICTVASNDTTMKSVAVVAASGSFTIYADAAATAETRVNFLVLN